MHLPYGMKRRIVDSLKGFPEVEEAWLFGSQARGDATADSDIDLMLVHGKDTASLSEDISILSHAANSLRWLHQPPYEMEYDLVPCSRRAFDEGFDGHFGGPLIKAVHKEGELLYAKPAGH